MPPRDDPAPVQSAHDLLTRWYEDHYSTTAATADGSLFERYLHRSMEAPYGPEVRYARVLEVGGNRGEHVPYVRHQFDEYLLTDLREPRPTERVAADPRIRVAACDVSELPYPDGGFDRVIATCLLHHLPDPFAALREMRRVAAPGGTVTILLPTDPGVVYRLGKALTSGRAARRQGIADLYQVVTALDHRNHFPSLLAQVRHVFGTDGVAVSWRPFRVPGWHLNAFSVVHARVRDGAGAGA
ncbi:class I SAM-dependent methyltransferase [Micromonospora sp. NPDC093277]|uniref:class I SAM-dependent methyltransferase n=1 Tax=Micromonospora sp. NPDC093277 TaxID=3364291 RepID=UPI0038198ACE